MVSVIGITGGIATGKSTVTEYLLKNGYVVLDSDRLSKEALMIDDNCIQQVKEAFDCVNDGVIDRKKLGQIVFHDKEAKKRLEAIIHPYVIQKLQEGILIYQNNEIMFLDIPLLYECHLEYLCDTIVLVYCDKETQLLRLMKRDKIDKEYANTIISNQMSIEDKKVKADIILDNTGTREQLLKQIRKLW